MLVQPAPLMLDAIPLKLDALTPFVPMDSLAIYSAPGSAASAATLIAVLCAAYMLAFTLDTLCYPVRAPSRRPPKKVRVNAIGRPIHDDGKFMGYEDARRHGWQPSMLRAEEPSTTVRPSSAAAAAVTSPATLRVNASGRPIHDDGKFMGYEDARRRGWQPVTQTAVPPAARAKVTRPAAFAAPTSTAATAPCTSHSATQPWNEFQRRVSGCGLTMGDVSKIYAKLRDVVDGADPSATLLACSGSWNGFQQELGGCGLSCKQMSMLYRIARKQTSGQ